MRCSSRESVNFAADLTCTRRFPGICQFFSTFCMWFLDFKTVDDDTCVKIARELGGLDPDYLVMLNEPRYAGLRRHSKLMAGTNILVPWSLELPQHPALKRMVPPPQDWSQQTAPMNRYSLSTKFDHR